MINFYKKTNRTEEKKSHLITNTLRTLSLFLVFLSGHFASAQNNQLEWVTSVGAMANAQDYGGKIYVDDNGNVYTTGIFFGTVDFDPGPGVYNLSSSFFDVFVSKLDASGNLVWAVNFGNASSFYNLSITADDNQNVYLAGNYGNTTDFDPGTGTYTLTPNGNTDNYILKLDNLGNFVWAKSFGTTSIDNIQSIAVDNNGNVLTTGYFQNTMDFDPGTGVQNLTSTLNSMYLLKLDALGNFVWVENFENTNMSSSSQGLSLYIDDNGNIYSTGIFQGTVDFDLSSTSSYNLTSNGFYDVFLSKIDMNANFIWAKSFGGTNADYGNNIDVDNDKNVYITGKFTNTVDFDPSANTFNLTSNGGEDAYVLKLDTSGNFLWAKAFGGIGVDEGKSIEVDANGYVYSIGMFQETVDFDPGSGTTNLSSNGSSDIYISKLNSLGELSWVVNIGGDGYDEGLSIALDQDGNPHATGTFNDTVDFDPGVGESFLYPHAADVFILKLSCAPSSGTHTVNACGSYNFNGITYTSDNNTATDTLVNSFGCDSIVTLNLTINNPTSGTDIQTSCNSYTWIDGNTYISSTNTPQFTLTNAAGCDSVVTLNLTVTEIDITTTVSNGVISSNAAGASYQWINCSDNSPISGETNANFTATASGNYAVVITDGNCIDTSACVSISTVGIKDVYFNNNAFQLYPNPANAQVTIASFEANINNISIMDLTGKIVQPFSPKTALIDVSMLQTGVYFIKIEQEGEIFTQKLVKH